MRHAELHSKMERVEFGEMTAIYGHSFKVTDFNTNRKHVYMRFPVITHHDKRAYIQK